MQLFEKSYISWTAFGGFSPIFVVFVPFQEEGEVPSDQSLKEFEGATLRYASINLKYAPWKLFLIIKNLADVVR